MVYDVFYRPNDRNHIMHTRLGYRAHRPFYRTNIRRRKVFAKVYASWALTGQQGPDGNNDIDIDDEGRFSLYRTLWVSQELPTDEAICAWGDIEVVTMNRSSFTSTNPALKGLYARLYFVVTIANHYLSETADMTGEEIPTKRAEVRYLRALAYYYLMDVFANVPFTTAVSANLPNKSNVQICFNGSKPN